MFGVIVSGRLVQTEFQQISPSEFLITIPDADNINHVVVFLTGVSPFPEGYAGQVYFSWPDPEAPPNWQVFGHISNSKPSAIFKISSLKKLHEINTFSDMRFGQSNICHSAQIGISVELIKNIIEVPSPSGPENNRTFAQKMLENFMNFILSYSITQGNMVPDPTATFVPLSTVQNWYRNFERRLTQNPNFWKK